MLDYPWTFKHADRNKKTVKNHGISSISPGGAAATPTPFKHATKLRYTQIDGIRTCALTTVHIIAPQKALVKPEK